MDTLTTTVRQVLNGYTGIGLNGVSVLTTNEEHRLFSVLGMGTVGGERITVTGLVVSLQGGFAVIEHDANDKPLVDALLQAGIPRERIILAYAGEAVPESEAAPAG